MRMQSWLGLLLAMPLLAQTTRPAAGNAEYEALQAHFERRVAERSRNLFRGSRRWSNGRSARERRGRS